MNIIASLRFLHATLSLVVTQAVTMILYQVCEFYRNPILDII